MRKIRWDAAEVELLSKAVATKVMTTPGLTIASLEVHGELPKLVRTAQNALPPHRRRRIGTGQEVKRLVPHIRTQIQLLAQVVEPKSNGHVHVVDFIPPPPPPPTPAELARTIPTATLIHELVDRVFTLKASCATQYGELISALMLHGEELATKRVLPTPPAPVQSAPVATKRRTTKVLVIGLLSKQYKELSEFNHHQIIEVQHMECSDTIPIPQVDWIVLMTKFISHKMDDRAYKHFSDVQHYRVLKCGGGLTELRGVLWGIVQRITQVPK